MMYAYQLVCTSCTYIHTYIHVMYMTCMYVCMHTCACSMYVHVHIHTCTCTAGFSVRLIFPMGRLKDVISPRLRGLRGQSLNPNVCTAHHDHGKLFFWSKTILRYFYDSKTIYGPVGGHLRHRANLNLAADLRTAVKTVRAESGKWPLIEPLLQRLTDVVRA